MAKKLNEKGYTIHNLKTFRGREPEDDKDRFHNFYRCGCGEEWEDYWSCACDDRCPRCNAEIEPYKYKEKDEEGNYHE